MPSKQYCPENSPNQKATITTQPSKLKGRQHPNTCFASFLRFPEGAPSTARGVLRRPCTNVYIRISHAILLPSVSYSLQKPNHLLFPFFVAQRYLLESTAAILDPCSWLDRLFNGTLTWYLELTGVGQERLHPLLADRYGRRLFSLDKIDSIDKCIETRQEILWSIKSSLDFCCWHPSNCAYKFRCLCYFENKKFSPFAWNKSNQFNQDEYHCQDVHQGRWVFSFDLCCRIIFGCLWEHWFVLWEMFFRTLKKVEKIFSMWWERVTDGSSREYLRAATSKPVRLQALFDQLEKEQLSGLTESNLWVIDIVVLKISAITRLGRCQFWPQVQSTCVRAFCSRVNKMTLPPATVLTISPFCICRGGSQVSGLLWQPCIQVE